MIQLNDHLNSCEHTFCMISKELDLATKGIILFIVNKVESWIDWKSIIIEWMLCLRDVFVRKIMALVWLYVNNAWKKSLWIHIIELWEHFPPHCTLKARLNWTNEKAISLRNGQIHSHWGMRPLKKTTSLFSVSESKMFFDNDVCGTLQQTVG